MTRDVQKETEEGLVRRFLVALGREDLLEDLQSRERPDFTTLDDDGPVGIEITELFRHHHRLDVPRQAQEGSWRSIAERARDLWRDAGLSPVHVWLFFNEQYHVKSTDVGDLSRTLVELVSVHLPEEGGHIQVRMIDLPYGTYPKELVFFTILRLPDSDEIHWLVNDAGFQGQLEWIGVQEAMDKKEPQRQEYPEDFRNWLVMVVHGTRISSSMEIPEEVVSKEYGSGFDRAYLFDTAGDQVRELLLTPKVRSGNVR